MISKIFEKCIHSDAKPAKKASHQEARSESPYENTSIAYSQGKALRFPAAGEGKSNCFNFK